MKITIINNGVQQLVDPEQIVVDNVTLLQLLERINKLESDFIDLKRKTTTREQQISEMVKKL